MIPHYTQPTEASSQTYHANMNSPESTGLNEAAFVDCFDPQLFHQAPHESSNNHSVCHYTPQDHAAHSSGEDLKNISWGNKLGVQDTVILSSQQTPKTIINRSSSLEIAKDMSNKNGASTVSIDSLKIGDSEFPDSTKPIPAKMTLNALWGLKTSKNIIDDQDSPEIPIVRAHISIPENENNNSDAVKTSLGGTLMNQCKEDNISSSGDSVKVPPVLKPKNKNITSKSQKKTLNSLWGLPEPRSVKPLCSVQKITIKTLGVKESKKKYLVTICLDKEKLKATTRPFLVTLKVRTSAEGRDDLKTANLDFKGLGKDKVTDVPLISASRSLQLPQRLQSLRSPSPPLVIPMSLEPSSSEVNPLNALKISILNPTPSVQPMSKQIIQNTLPTQLITSDQPVQPIQSIQSDQSIQSIITAQPVQPSKPKAIHPFFMKKAIKKQSTTILQGDVKRQKNESSVVSTENSNPLASFKLTRNIGPLSSKLKSSKLIKNEYPLLPTPFHIRDPSDNYCVPSFESPSKSGRKMKSKALEVLDYENIVNLSTKDSIESLSANISSNSSRSYKTCPTRELWNKEKLRLTTLEKIPDADKNPLYRFLFDKLGTLSAFDKASREEQQWSDKYSPKFTGSVAVEYSRGIEVLNWVTKRSSYLKNLRSSEPAAIKKQKFSKTVTAGNSVNDLADFVVDDELEYESDATDSDESLESSVLFLSGPSGVGKTTSVYACGEELGAYIFEINSSQKRSAKELMTLFEGMSRSHIVHKNTTSFSGDNSKEEGVINVLDNSAGSNSAKVDYKKMGILLLEDVDVLFQDDKTFWTGVEKFIEVSRRPIIMTFSDISAIPLSIQESYNHTNIQLSRCSSTVLKNILWLIALNEGHLLEMEVLDTLVSQNNFDLKSAISSLQFWCQMGLGDDHGGLYWTVPYRKRMNDASMKDVRVISVHTISLSDLEANSIKKTCEKDVGNTEYYDGSKVEDYITKDSLFAFAQLCENASFSDVLKAQNHTCFEQEAFELKTEISTLSAGSIPSTSINNSLLFSSASSAPRSLQTSEYEKDSLIGIERINNHVKKHILPLTFEDAYMAEEVMFRSQKLISEKFNCKYFTSVYMPMPFNLQSFSNFNLRQPFINFTYRSANHSWYNSIDTLSKWKLTTDITPYIRHIAFHELVKLAIFEERTKNMEDTQRRSARSARALGFDILPRPYLDMDSFELDLLMSTGGRLNQMVKR